MSPIPRRLSASILLSVLSIFTITALLPNSSVSSHLRNIQVWTWGEAEKSAPRGPRLVVFGDSWADNERDPRFKGQGVGWTDVLCAKLSCSSHLNFARTQPSSDYPSCPPTGVLSSNEILYNVLAKSRALVTKGGNSTLPDLAAQVQSFISLPPPREAVTETIFVVSTGFWDVYFASFDDFDKGAGAIDSAIQAVFDQLDLLYLHFTGKLAQTSSSGKENTTTTQKFQVIISKLFDPALLPGWQSQRPVPLRPNNIAEQQKNAVYLTNRWSVGLENKLGGWMTQIPSGPPAFKIGSDKVGEHGAQAEKDVFYHDLPGQLLDLIVENTLEVAGLSDGSGLGSGTSPFEDTYIPCVADSEEGGLDSQELEEVDGILICKDSERYLWWDSWRLGSVANENVGQRVATMVKEGDSLRAAWKEAGKIGA